MSNGKQIYSSAPLYRDDQKSVIKVINYDGTFYVFQFIKDISDSSHRDGKTKKQNHGKYSREGSALKVADSIVNDRKLDRWKSNDNIFSAINNQSEEKQIKSFLDKYGSK